MTKKRKVICILGKAGSGKDTLKKYLCDNYGEIFSPLVTYTTRPKRENEIDGRDYYFISEEEWQKREWFESLTFNNWHYSSSLESFLRDKITVAIVTPKGCRFYLSKRELEVVGVYQLLISDKGRLLRQLKRETEPDCKEICRRFLADEEDFKDVDDIPNLIRLPSLNKTDISYNADFIARGHEKEII